MTRRTKVLGSLALAAVGFAGIAGGPSYGYNPPDGPNFTTASGDPHTHGKIVLKALDVLAGDGNAEMRDFFTQNKQFLLNGVRQADRSHGDTHVKLSVLGQVVKDQPIEANSMSHFYNPKTGKGFQLSFGEPADTAVAAARAASVGPWELSTYFGPHPAATDMADWAYAQAVDAMRKGNRPLAMEQLGWAVHYIADLTVPQHATDEGGPKSGSLHVEYEAGCDTALEKADFPHATNGGIYHDTWRPGQFGEEAANQSAPLVGKAKNKNTWSEVQVKMIPLAERLTAGLLARFYRRWQDEDFNVVLVTMNRVRDLTGDIDSGVSVGPEADFYAKINVDGKGYQTGVVDGGDDIQPNKIVPYAWVFPKWLSKSRPIQANAGELGGSARLVLADGTGRVDRVPVPQPVERTSGIIIRPRIEVTNTNLQIWNGTGGEFESYGATAFRDLSITNFQWKFIWGTKDVGVKSANWYVSDKPIPAGGEPANVLGKGNTTIVPAAGKQVRFDVDLGPFMAKAMADKNGQKTLYVRLQPLNAQGEAAGAISNSVELRHGKNDQPGTVFDIPSDNLLHPKVRIISYGPLAKKTSNNVNVAAIITLEISNPTNKTTDAVPVYVADNSHYFKRDTPMALPSMKPHERIERRFIMEPDLVYWRNEMLKKYKNVNPSGGEIGFWSENFRTTANKVDFEVRTYVPETATQARSERKQDTFSVRAAVPFPEPVKIDLGIWDSDSGANGGDDHCDVNPVTGMRDLSLTYRFDGIVEWSGDTFEGEGYRTDVSTSGNESDKAEVSISIQRWPIPPQVGGGMARRPASPAQARMPVRRTQKAGKRVSALVGVVRVASIR